MEELLDNLNQKVISDVAVSTAVLFGSRARGASNQYSDIDIHMVVRDLSSFKTGSWFRQLGNFNCRLFCVKSASGGATKITALYRTGAIDFVVLSRRRILLARFAVTLGLHRRVVGLRKKLSALSVVLRPGFDVIKGSRGWVAFYDRIVSEVEVPRLSYAEIVQISNTAYIDALWCCGKARNGELIAAQRWLHRNPFEANIQLLNELRLRTGRAPSYDARRAESVLDKAELDMIRLDFCLDAEEIIRCARHSIRSTRYIVSELIGSAPDWDDF